MEQYKFVDLSGLKTAYDTLDEKITDVASSVASATTALTGKMSEPSTEGTNGQVLTTDGNGGRTWTTVDAAPETYIKTASVSNNTLTLTKQDNTTVTFQGGSGGSVEIDDNTIQYNSDDQLYVPALNGLETTLGNIDTALGNL